jgi:hypothetical protein
VADRVGEQIVDESAQSIHRSDRVLAIAEVFAAPFAHCAAANQVEPTL